MSSKPTVIGGKLKLKGDPKSVTAKKAPTTTSGGGESEKVSGQKRQLDGEALGSDEKDKEKESYLTEAQKRFKQKKLERENEDVKKIASVSFRERIEKFNEKLSKLTEHNDIPRVSAAGNG